MDDEISGVTPDCPVRSGGDERRADDGTSLTDSEVLVGLFNLIAALAERLTGQRVKVRIDDVVGLAGSALSDHGGGGIRLRRARTARPSGPPGGRETGFLAWPGRRLLRVLLAEYGRRRRSGRSVESPDNPLLHFPVLGQVTFQVADVAADFA